MRLRGPACSEPPFRPYNPRLLVLTAGTRLGPYDIATQIRVGGMAEVCQATDTNLDRTVALKVLPEHVATDPDLKQRFEREAKTISCLNHGRGIVVQDDDDEDDPDDVEDDDGHDEDEGDDDGDGPERSPGWSD